MEDNKLFIGTIMNDATKSLRYENIEFGGQMVSFKLDTGSQANIIPCEIYHLSNVVFTSYQELSRDVFWRMHKAGGRDSDANEGPRPEVSIHQKRKRYNRKRWVCGAGPNSKGPCHIKDKASSRRVTHSNNQRPRAKRPRIGK